MEMGTPSQEKMVEEELDDEDGEEKSILTTDPVDIRKDVEKFHLNPASAISGPLDFIKASAKKLYSLATTNMFRDDDLFDCTPGEMYHFLSVLDTRAGEYERNSNWTGVLWISEGNLKTPGKTRYIPLEYGKVTMKQLKAHEW